MIPREQLRLTAAELDEYLATQRTARVATVDDDGVPHVVPLWFVWHDGSLWLNSLRKTRRHRHLTAGSPVGLVVDDGDRYSELRGVRMTGRPEVVPDDDPAAVTAYRMFGRKYFDRDDLPSQASYETVRITPDEIASWDFRKIPTGGDRKLELDG